MSKNAKMTVVGLAILVAGAAFGWTSRMATSSPDTTLPMTLKVTEPENVGLKSIQTYQPAPARRTTPRANTPRSLAVAAGTPVAVAMNQALSSKTAGVGESWSGEVTESVYRNGRVVIPAGSRVSGTVVAARPAARGDRAMLQLAMTSVSIDGRSYRIRGSSEPMVAGSPRGRNIGAIAGATAAGALIGKAVGGSSKSTVIGAVVGGTAATAAVAASKGYQVEVPSGKEITFTTSSSVNVRA